MKDKTVPSDGDGKKSDKNKKLKTAKISESPDGREVGWGGKRSTHRIFIK